MARLAYPCTWKNDKIRVRGESDIKVGMRVLKCGVTTGRTDGTVDFIYHDAQLPGNPQNTRYKLKRMGCIRSFPREAFPDLLYWIRRVGLSAWLLGVLLGLQRFCPDTKSGVYLCFLYYADDFDWTEGVSLDRSV